ncbi:MAG: HNH endonuclease [Candidatus Paceibacterota bacterium]|jgi:hypothetical protein
MKFELEKFHRNVTDAEIIADVRRVASELKQNFLTMSQYGKHGKFDNSTPKRRFGSWSKALELAGLGKSKIQLNTRLSDEELFKNLEEAWTKLGRQPRSTEMFDPISKYSAAVYKRHFGSWMKALEIFVEFINKEDAVLTEETIKNLQAEPKTKHKTQRGVNWRLRFLVMRRDNFKCKNCGWSPATGVGRTLEVDHIFPWSKGGETTIENLQTLCSRCNSGKSNLE